MHIHKISNFPIRFLILFVIITSLVIQETIGPINTAVNEKFLQAGKKYLGVPFVWGGRSKERLDCMGLLFLAYKDITGRDWRELSVLPSKLVASGKLGKPVKGLDGVLKENLKVEKLKNGDVIYFLVKEKVYDTDVPLVNIDSIPYWVWHMGIFAGFDSNRVALCLNAKPGDKVVIEPLNDIYFDAIFVTRFGEPRDEIIKNLQKLMADNKPIFIYTIVALCDNKYQGIVPVPPELGNGDDPKNNLYWGASGGVKTYFKKSNEWQMIASDTNISKNVLERCIFKRKGKNIYLIADAYRGSAIKEAIFDFLCAVAKDTILRFENQLMDGADLDFKNGVVAQLVCYVGHNGLLDFSLDSLPEPAKDKDPKDVIILACLSKNTFYDILDSLGGYPLLWTTGLLAPEAYTLKSAIDGWIALESGDDIKIRAAKAYNRFQKCGLNAAKRLFETGR
ncbi:MAG: C40 family peptidase [candidate division WOR-3 bacterium]|nr:C40 family peptidase [candidate division WOR-3 bacterium]